MIVPKYCGCTSYLEQYNMHLLGHVLSIGLGHFTTRACEQQIAIKPHYNQHHFRTYTLYLVDHHILSLYRFFLKHSVVSFHTFSLLDLCI